MDNESDQKITLFDSYYTNDRIRILKILLPEFPQQIRPVITLFIKLYEFLLTFRYLKGFASTQDFPTPDISRPIGFPQWISAVTPYCDEDTAALLSSVLSAFTNYDTIKETMETINELKDVLPDEIFSFDENNTDQLTQLMNMLNQTNS